MIDFKFYSGVQLAFSDVVLSPVVFAGTLVPEPRTWLLLIAGAAVIGCRVRTQGGRTRAQR